MTSRNRIPNWKPWHGFAVEIGPDTDLGGEGMLILEHAAGGYEPIAAVSTINEAQELATGRVNDPAFTGRLVVWARGVGGTFLKIPVVIDGRRK